MNAKQTRKDKICAYSEGEGRGGGVGGGGEQFCVSSAADLGILGFVN